MKKTFGDKIKERRKQRHFTQSQLAKMLGVSASAVGMYEQGRREPDNKTLLKLCEIFDTSSDYLLGNLDSSRADEKDGRRTVEVSEVFDEFTEKLMSQQGLMFDGTPLNEQDRMKIIDALKVVAALARQEHKKSLGEA